MSSHIIPEVTGELVVDVVNISVEAKDPESINQLINLI